MEHLDPADHAFASGPVFRRPNNLLDAVRLTRSFNAGRRLLQIWRQFEARGEMAPTVKLSLTARAINRAARSALSVGPDAMVRGILRVEPNGELEIGEAVYIGDGTIISAAARLSIGPSTFLAHGVQVFDNDTHPLDPTERQNHLDRIIGRSPKRTYTVASAPVKIGKQCWIGMNSIILKGTTIGDTSIVAAGSVVSRDVEPGWIVAGNPAQPIRRVVG